MYMLAVSEQFRDLALKRAYTAANMFIELSPTIYFICGFKEPFNLNIITFNFLYILYIVIFVYYSIKTETVYCRTTEE